MKYQQINENNERRGGSGMKWRGAAVTAGALARRSAARNEMTSKQQRLWRNGMRPSRQRQQCGATRAARRRRAVATRGCSLSNS